MPKYFYYFKALLIFTISSLSVNSLAENSFPFDYIKDDLQAYSDGKVYRSISILKNILIIKPDNHRARLELASAYYHLSLYDLAIEQLNIVISADNMPKNVAKNTHDFLYKIRKSKDDLIEQNKNILLNLKLFVGFDTNANFGPPDKYLDIGILSEQYVAQQDTLFGAQLELDHQYHFSGSTNIKDYAVYSSWESKFTLYTQQYNDHDTSNFNLIRLNTGPLFKVTPLFAVKFNFKLDHYEFFQKSLATIYTFKPQLKLQLKSNQYLGINLAYSDRQFNAKADNYREGKQLQNDIYFTHKINDTLRYKVGMSFKNRNLGSDYLSFNSIKYQLLIEKEFFSKHLIQFISNYEKYHYGGIEKYYDNKRDDSFIRSRIKYEQKINDKFSYGIQLTHYNRRSNHELHSYIRNIVETYLSFKY
jgi:hypothetical protein